MKIVRLFMLFVFFSLSIGEATGEFSDVDTAPADFEANINGVLVDLLAKCFLNKEGEKNFCTTDNMEPNDNFFSAEDYRNKGNCVITPASPLGQGNGYAAGGHGNHGELEVPPQEPELLFLGSQLPNNTKIILVDDFDNILPNANISHGDLVRQHLNKIIGNAAANAITEFKIEYGYQTGVIADELKNSLEGVDGFVNMSWAIIPCVFTENFDITTLEADYTAALENIPQVVKFREQLTELANSQNLPVALDKSLQILIENDEDKFYNYLNQLVEGGHNPTFNRLLLQFILIPLPNDPLIGIIKEYSGITFVASAGNYGLPYPLAPAMWDEVIAVGSYTILDPTNSNNVCERSRFSNYGQVLAAGASFIMNINNEDVLYEGTSFAAPTVATLLALDPNSIRTFRNYKKTENEFVGPPCLP